jgi:hypothetical protein
MGDETLSRASSREKTNGDKDPSPNVLDLVASAMQRQDDLREAASKREDDLREMSTQHVEAMASLRAEHFFDLQNKETERLDAIRLVDTGAVTRAAEVSALQAQTLATSQATIAETLRGQVSAAAVATAAALATALAPITKAIEDLRQAQYQQQGEKSQQVDMRTDPTLIAIKELTIAQHELVTRIKTEEVGVDKTRARDQWSIGLIVTLVFGITGTLGTILGAVYLIVSKASGH